LENFVQSHTGVIHVFPVVPDDFEGGFERLGAQGAFVISAERAKDGVRALTIASLAGNPCVLANPWPEKTIKVIDLETAREVSTETAGRTLHFRTVRDHRYRVKTAGANQPEVAAR
jgi:hypothetical protein